MLPMFVISVGVLRIPCHLTRKSQFFTMSNSFLKPDKLKYSAILRRADVRFFGVTNDVANVSFIADGHIENSNLQEAADAAQPSKPSKKKVRLDVLLVDRGLVQSRTLAQSLVLAGKVFVNEECISKVGTPVLTDASIQVKGKQHPWVSRGGIKLAHALQSLSIDPTGFVCLDVGASTGGFTDVLLTQGAAKVYAVDVGYGQLAWKLRSDPRVVVLERTNARALDRELIPDPIDLIVCDASFIGLQVVLPAAMALGHSEPHKTTKLVALIKPQFEVGKGRVGKGGVVRDPALHEEVCEKIRGWLEDDTVHGPFRWTVLGLQESPIKGPEGNKEFLIAAEGRIVA
mmetsp:Transcript_13687/g.23481  ORF Transcript_13687/g.23481 Transcript_13687/m.23481 type:complete len:344 (+) Transcript_13687:29-1060(+)